MATGWVGSRLLRSPVTVLAQVPGPGHIHLRFLKLTLLVLSQRLSATCLAAGPASLLLHEPARQNPCERLLLRAVRLSHGAPENPFFLWVPDSFQEGFFHSIASERVSTPLFSSHLVAWVRGPPTPTIRSAFLPRCPQPQNGCTTVAGQVSLLQHLLGGSEPAMLQGRRRRAPDKRRAGPGGADREHAPLGSAPPSKSTPAPAAGFVLSRSLPIKGNMEATGLVHPSRFARHHGELRGALKFSCR